VDGRHNYRNEAVFSKSSGVVQTAPYTNSLRENEKDKLVTVGREGGIRVVLEEISTKHDYTLLMVRSI